MSLASNGARGAGRVVESVSVDKWVEVNGHNARPYIVYVITVRLPPRQKWTVKRRYTEFCDLALAFEKDPPEGAGRPAPLALPPKRALQTGWRQTLSFGSHAAQEHAQMLAEERLPALREWIRALLEDADPQWRSSRALRTFLALPDHAQFNMAVTARDTRAKDSVSHAGSPRDTAAPGAWNGPGIRRLGPAAYSASPALSSPAMHKAQETSSTRGLDDHDLLQNQADVMERQDGHLRDLATSIRRQRELGLTINQELREHTEMLGQMDRDLDGVQDKMAAGNKLMRTLDHDRAY